jgi:lipopolysaccharide transport system permease protein
MRDFPTTPIEMIASLWRNRELIGASVKREVLGRYRGSFLGLLWSFLNPLFMLTVYTFVFSVIFKARWGSGDESKSQFALVLFSGLLVFNIFSECVTRAPTLVLNNPNYVKKVVFPLEILPFIALLSALYHAMVSLAVWLLAHLVLIGAPPATIFLLPLIIAPFALLIMGLSWMLASLGVFLRDISQFIAVLVTASMFLSPVFYPANSLPDRYQELLYLNPLTTVIEVTRKLMYLNELPEFSMILLYWAVGMTVAWSGFACFQKIRKGFADVI